ncbi:MAG: SCO family protein [Deltaproteobacteria bacterium]|nr:SCO family protein [Deltaproteobacteria bacterium]
MTAIVILRRLLWALVAFVCVAIVGVAIWRWQGRAMSEAKSEPLLEGLKNFGAVPDFTFTERSGRKVSLADLKGKVWVAQFFYTRCTDICPLTVPQMGLLHLEYLNDPEFRSAIHFVSITVDPERDTPEVLSKYADRFSADPDLWFFLTGDKADTYRLAQQGFKLGIGEELNAPEIAKKTGEEKEFFHSNRLILIDRKAQVRGYYAGIDAEAMVRLRRDLKILLAEKLTS